MTIVKKVWFKVAATLSIVMAVCFITSAYTNKNASPVKTETKRLTTWYFTGDNINQANDADFYTTEDPQLGCGSASDVPCELVVDAANQTELAQFMQGKSGEEIRDDYAASLRAQ